MVGCTLSGAELMEGEYGKKMIIGRWERTLDVGWNEDGTQKKKK